MTPELQNALARLCDNLGAAVEFLVLMVFFYFMCKD